jgi:uncharacterized protein (TIGR03083 family)
MAEWSDRVMRETSVTLSGPTFILRIQTVGMDERTGMGLGREQAISGLLAEYEALGGLVRSLGESEWTKPSRCEGWEVGDVARHVVGTAADVAAGQAGSHTPEEEVAARKNHTPSQLADELEGALGTLRNLGALIDDDAWNGPSPVPDLTMRQGILVLLYDAYVHGDDIRVAAGLPPSGPGIGLDASVEYLGEQLADRDWGPATLALDGMEKIDVRGGGDPVTGDPKQFVLAATGRADPSSFGLDEKVNIYAEA